MKTKIVRWRLRTNSTNIHVCILTNKSELFLSLTRVMFAETSSNVSNVSGSGEVFAVFVEGNRHDSISCVERFLDTVSVVYVYVYIQHSLVVPDRIIHKQLSYIQQWPVIIHTTLSRLLWYLMESLLNKHTTLYCGRIKRRSKRKTYQKCSTVILK